MVTERKFREQEVQIARYRLLEREVTDPLAASLLHIIILELEADLQTDCVHGSINQRPLWASVEALPHNSAAYLVTDSARRSLFSPTSY
jgi:hypothetical protein